MGERRQAREFALQVLYSMDSSGFSSENSLRLFWSMMPDVSPEVRLFTEQLVAGVGERLAEIDGIITNSSTNWKISRMAIVDRNILRIAIYELYWCSDIPVRVTLNEAIEIAKQYGTEESGSFINGILDKAAKGTSKE